MELIVLVLLGILWSVFWSCLMALPVMWLWNSAAVAAIPGLHTIGFWHALGILLLCQLLFKSSSSSSSKSSS